ncbi:MAG: MMPL family transporter [Pelagibacteraceae bacterium]|nr:MMPL family transporter [Pelagibacteraceae bacterium]MCI5079012.1 MMPL family transporter [Pelagibacteraceae bacterium]
MFGKFYNKILQYPFYILLIFTTLFLFSIYQSKNFELDASADTLLIDNDPDLIFLRQLNKKYKSEEFFIITYTPNNSNKKETIKELEKLVLEINNFRWISKTISVINAPLLQSTNEPLMDRIKNLKYITSDNINTDKAIKELTTSPVYKNLIISEDSKTFGIVAFLKDNKPYLDAIDKKTKLLLSKEINKKDLELINQKLKRLQKQQSNKISEYNASIKKLISNYQSNAEIRLSGIPMIADDMISFIKNDIIIFGFGVFLFIIFTLWYVFKNINWVIFPLLNCLLAITLMIGFLSVAGWKVTVISSNFIALMLILTMSMNIHYLVRYMQVDIGDYNSEELKERTNYRIKQTSNSIFFPILYAVLTTICAFLSLVFSEIKPVIDFGWMMTIGLFISFSTTFLFLPTLIKIFKPPLSENLKSSDSKIAKIFLYISNKNKFIYLTSLFLIIISFVGISNLKVENSFINYFDKDTEIYKGMKNIDEKLGGTTPLEIILKFKTKKLNDNDDDSFLGSNENKEDDFLGGQISQNDNSKYWFTRDKIDKIVNIHKYLENQPEIGKVLSFSSILSIAESLNNNKKLGSLEMGVLYEKLPNNIKEQIIKPYISIKDNEARITMRIKDSKKDLRRKELINRIQNDLQTKFKINSDEFKLAGVLIIFNNLLQSLFDSQIKTLGIVMAGIFVMFFVLFRSIKLSIIGIVPNFIAATFVLGFIGILNIPLDMMTITIAAITIGIAVDNSIHYIYRFKFEKENNNIDGKQITSNCHQSVGKAIISTSFTIIFGFSILVLSNFIPTIYFGLFTGLAMLTALFLVLTLLPNLLNKFYTN